MGVVKVMDPVLSDKIAAGEVVETLMNVVKELVENAIDASATSITVELKESGLNEIKVIDNGKGMTKEDAILALRRHATSKLYTDDDLNHIHTLGFRGEALPSIASVSKMRLITCNGEEGTELYIEGGILKEEKNAELLKGTTIIIKSIFYNTPARLKYLKSLYTELSNIISYLNRMALAHPEIRFTLINNDKQLLKTDGSGNIKKVIHHIYGLDVIKKMVFLTDNTSDYDVELAMSYPEVTKSNRNAITILVNGRSVRSNELNHSILESYHTYIPKDRFPIVIVSIKADPTIIDVNIHPTKMEIKFSKLEELRMLIEKMITSSLEKLVLIPEIKYEDKPVINLSEVTTIDTTKTFEDESKKVVLPKFDQFIFDYEIKEEEKEQELTTNEGEEIETPQKEKFKMIEPKALIHGTYIIGENEDGMYVLDQHAVNERINYEFYKKELGKNDPKTIDLLIPISYEFSQEEFEILKQHFDILEKLGISYELFGRRGIVVRSHPVWIKKNYVKESLNKIFEVIIQKESFDKEKFNEKVAITLACKMSIKANEHISDEEMRTLILRLRECENPFTCPHGRPTIITYSKYELEKLFKRAM